MGKFSLLNVKYALRKFVVSCGPLQNLCAPISKVTMVANIFLELSYWPYVFLSLRIAPIKHWQHQYLPRRKERKGVCVRLSFVYYGHRHKQRDALSQQFLFLALHWCDQCLAWLGSKHAQWTDSLGCRFCMKCQDIWMHGYGGNLKGWNILFQRLCKEPRKWNRMSESRN